MRKPSKQEIRLGAIYLFSAKRSLPQQSIIQLLTERHGMNRDQATVLTRHWITTLPFRDRPFAAPGLTSYRYRGGYGFIMIGARDVADALSEASRSLTASKARVDYLQIWNGKEYINVL